MQPDDLAPASRVVTLGRGPGRPGDGVSPPLELSSTFHADGPVDYARVGNPTWTAFEEALGALEGGIALVHSSGMAAVAAVLSLVPPGGTVVAPGAAYSGVVATLAQRDAAGTLAVRWVDPGDRDAMATAVTGADLVWVESPSNPLLDLVDLGDVVTLAHAAGALVAADNTFCTPLLAQPLTDGVDVVVHSVTKYLAGHSDVVLGATVTAADETGQELAGRLHGYRTLAGSVAGPMETWLALRGLRTLSVRLERACASAADLAARLRDHPAVQRVRYPGFGAIISIEVVGGAAGAEAVTAATRLWVHSTSLGGVESQVERRRRHAAEPPAVPEALVRLSVGIEDVEDLWRDLLTALSAALACVAETSGRGPRRPGPGRG